MKFKRKITLFWIKHSGRIMFWIGTFAIVIFITQTLNSMAEKKIEDEKQNIISESINNEEKSKEYIEDSKVTNFVRKFIYLCNEETVKDAYSMLSEECKSTKYNTYDIFYNNYYKKFFLGNYTYEEIEFNSKDNTYTLTFYESALITGTLKNRKNITSTIKVEESVLERRIIILD